MVILQNSSFEIFNAPSNIAQIYSVSGTVYVTVFCKLIDCDFGLPTLLAGNPL